MTGSHRPLVAVYADESCLGNGREGQNRGGAGVLVEFRKGPDEPPVRRDLWVSEPDTTNNRMALRSVIEAMAGLSRKGRRFSVVFTTDSRYIVDGMTAWVHDWARRGWTRKSGPIENLDLWKKAVKAVAAGGHEVQWKWVRGHDGHAQNEYANHLATRAAAVQTDSDGFIESAFDPWCRERPASASPLVLESFPSEERFRPSRSLPAP